MGSGRADALGGLEGLGVDDRLVRLTRRPHPVGLGVPAHHGLVAEGDVVNIDEDLPDRSGPLARALVGESKTVCRRFGRLADACGAFVGCVVGEAPKLGACSISAVLVLGGCLGSWGGHGVR
jgi:hypothetical protein